MDAHAIAAGKNTVLFWQSDDNDVGEPAVAIERYSDIIQLVQKKAIINLNLESLPQFIAALRTAAKMEVK